MIYSKVSRVPEISDEQIDEMRHIEPVLRVGDSCWYRRIAGISAIDPRNTSFLWDATPIGGLFRTDLLNETTIITQHTSSVFFKPSLSEVYSWIRLFLDSDWRDVKFFCMGTHDRITGTTDVWCQCRLIAGEIVTE